MDPDEALSQLRELIKKLSFIEQCNDEDAYLADKAEVADKFSDIFEGFDTWLTTGGFLPRDWARQGVDRRMKGFMKEILEQGKDERQK